MNNLRQAAQKVASEWTMGDISFDTMRELRAALAEPQPEPAIPKGWDFKRNKDGSIGIFAPPPKPGESQRTSDVVYPSRNNDLHEMLGKLADHLASQPPPEAPGTTYRFSATSGTALGIGVKQ